MDYSELAIELLQKMLFFHKNVQFKQMNNSFQGGAFILQYIYHQGNDVLPGEISDEMSISTARVAAALNNLEKKGLITRQIDKSNRRQILVALTPKGKEVAERKEMEIQNGVAQVLQKLDEYDARELVRIIGRITEPSNNSEP